MSLTKYFPLTRTAHDLLLKVKLAMRSGAELRIGVLVNLTVLQDCSGKEIAPTEILWLE